jgi:hypothetical protein
MSKSVVIIGAGVAGLATGCYPRMDAYDRRLQAGNIRASKRFEDPMPRASWPRARRSEWTRR